MKSAWRRHLAGPAAASDAAYSLSNAASCACNPSSVAPGAPAACGVTALGVKGGCSAGRGLQVELVHSYSIVRTAIAAAACKHRQHTPATQHKLVGSSDARLTPADSGRSQVGYII